MSLSKQATAAVACREDSRRSEISHTRSSLWSSGMHLGSCSSAHRPNGIERNRIWTGKIPIREQLRIVELIHDSDCLAGQFDGCQYV